MTDVAPAPPGENVTSGPEYQPARFLAEMPAGLPRPRGEFQGRTLPIPYVTELDPWTGRPRWSSADPQRRSLCCAAMLCQVCGEPLGQRVVILYPVNDKHVTDGAFHPRCRALAERFCPHFLAEAERDWYQRKSRVAEVDIDELPPKWRRSDGTVSLMVPYNRRTRP